MKNYIQEGDIVELTAPSGGVVAGTAYLIGAVVVVALTTVAQTLKFNALMRGVGYMPKATGQAWTEGAILYWDNTNKNFTTTSAGNTKCGFASAAAASGDTVGYVFLQGVV